MKYRSNIKNFKSLNIDPVSSLVVEAKYIHSPNFDLRPENTEISLLVIHGISLPPGEFSAKSEDYIINLFTNNLDPEIHPYFKEIYQMQVSCHCLITRNGKLIQFVPFKYRAWHAGKSNFLGRENCNDFSIGIELEGTDDLPYTTKQYEVLKLLINVIRKNYSMISLDRIIGHCDIAYGRKTDPGKSFDWKWVAKNFR